MLRTSRLLVAATIVAGTVATYIGISPAAEASGTGTVTGTIFNDANRNGVLDAGETGFSGLFVDLTNSTGSVSLSTTTDSSGAFSFAGLADGTYQVFMDPQSWNGMSNGWTPTTTGSLKPSVSVSLTGSATVPMGLRAIVRSTTKTSPISSYVGPNGLTVNSYDDVVTAKQVFDDLMTGTEVGAEASTVTILFDWGSASQTSYGASGNSSGYYNYHATSAITWGAWLTNGDLDLFHEYGHAWSMYYAYIVQKDPNLTSYLQARGLYGDPRIGTSYAWDPHEMIAEDYRELFGSANAQSFQQMNGDIPRASQVAGLKDFLTTTFTGANAPAPSPSPSPSTSPAPSPSPAPSSSPTPAPSPSPTKVKGGGGKSH